MTQPLDDALAGLRPHLLDTDRLVRAVGAGHRRTQHPEPARVELRPVDLKGGRRLQLLAYPRPGVAPLTSNHPLGEAAGEAVDRLLAQPYGNWHVETVEEVIQLRVTRKGQALVHTARTSRRRIDPAGQGHDRSRERLLDPGDPLFTALGADADKRRQVDAFLRLLAPTVAAAAAGARAAGRPLRVVDLGCGNAYLTFAAHRYLTGREDLAPGDGPAAGGVHTVGVELRPELVARNRALAAELGMAGLEFVEGSIAEADLGPEPVDLVLALHACDTATDEALARAVRWRAAVVLAAPCCHRDVQRQLTRQPADDASPYGVMIRHGILRQRFADLLTDSLRAGELARHGYRVEVVEFVDSRHTPRNALLRARLRRDPGPEPDPAVAQAEALARQWQVTPALARMLATGAGRP